MVKEVNFEDVKRDVIHAFTNGCMCSESVITIATSIGISGWEMT